MNKWINVQSMNMVYVRFCSWNKEKIYFFCFWKLSVQFSKHKISGIFRNSIIPIWVRSFVGLRMRKNRLTTSEFACFQNQQISGGRSNARKLRMTHTLPDRYNVPNTFSHPIWFIVSIRVFVAGNCNILLWRNDFTSKKKTECNIYERATHSCGTVC